MSAISKKLRTEIESVRKEIRNRTIGYIVAAFGLVAGLAWNDAIKTLIDYFFPATKNGLQAKFIYATVLTLFIVMVTVYLMRMVKKDEEEKIEKISTKKTKTGSEK